jgi:hypothetical protein
VPTTIHDLLADLASAFPRNGTTPETIRVYARELGDVQIEALERAVRDLIRTAEFFPTVRAIREACAERALGLPDEAGALEQVDALLSWARLDERERPDDPPALHPVVKDALVAVGGSSTFREADATVVRGQFGRIYRGLRAGALLSAQLDGVGLPAAAERRQIDR